MIKNSTETKIVSAGEVTKRIFGLRKNGHKIVFTNGCFDLIHVGHVRYLESAKNLGGGKGILIVGLNSDKSVRQLKGKGRPINKEHDRAVVLSALAVVDYIVVFGEKTAEKIIAKVRPDIYAKGGDYTIDTINQDERRLVEKIGGKIFVISPAKGKSTTKLIRKIKGGARNSR